MYPLCKEPLATRTVCELGGERVIFYIHGDPVEPSKAFTDNQTKLLFKEFRENIFPVRPE